MIKTKYKPSLALLLGLCASIFLAALGNPGNPAPLLAWVSLVPLLYALQHHANSKLSFVLTLGLFGFVWWSVTVAWLIPAAVDFIDMRYGDALLVYFLCCLSLSLPYWLAGLGLYYCRNLPWKSKVLAQAATLTLLLSLIGVALPGNLAHQLYLYPKFIQISEFSGQAGLLFATLICSASLAQIERRRLVACLLLAALPVALTFAYGHWRLNHKPEVLTSIRLASLQPNYNRQSQLSDVIDQSQALLSSQTKTVDLLVWPELPTVFSYIESSRQRQQVQQLLASIDTPLLLTSGYIYPEPAQEINGQRGYFNGANLIQADGSVSASYYKQDLVPFFEYLPFESELPQLRRIFPDSYNYIAGSQQTPLNFNGEIKIAALLCYESLFADTVQQQVAQGANIFINQGNDGWFGMSLGSERHLALALFRSVENRVPWLRATNSGISIATTAFGEVVAGSRTELQQQTSRIVELEIYRQQSFYSRYPNALTLALLLLLTSIFILQRNKQRP